MRAALVVVVIAGCTRAADPAAPQPDMVRLPPAAPDLSPTQQPLPDLLEQRVAVDMAHAPVDLAEVVDMATAPTIDLAPPSDLVTVVCGAMGQPPCASTGCSSGLIPVYATDQCGSSRPAVCTAPMNCGGYPLPCCTPLGQPTSIGYCGAGTYCSSGHCATC